MFKVMIVDDEPNIRKGLPFIINWQEYNFTVSSVARNGKDAIRKLKNVYPDLIITDIKMPVINGLELIHYVREKLNDKKMPFIILSGYSDFDFARKGIKYNVRSYLLKPIDEDELIKTLREIKRELSGENVFEYFYNERIENFDNKYSKMKEFKELIEAIEDKKMFEIEKIINDIFNLFRINKFHPDIIRLHLDNFFIKISNIITEMGGAVENIKNRGKLLETPISELNIIQLKSILLEFSKKSSIYINELSESSNIINRVKQHINKYYYRNLKLKSIAERFYINPAYLGRLFKKETGKCFSHYLNEKRLQTAKELLERTDLHVYQVARRVGYQNTDYFIIKFKKREQCTPMEYRRKSNDTEYN